MRAGAACRAGTPGHLAAHLRKDRHIIDTRDHPIVPDVRDLYAEPVRLSHTLSPGHRPGDAVAHSVSSEDRAVLAGNRPTVVALFRSGVDKSSNGIEGLRLFLVQPMSLPKEVCTVVANRHFSNEILPNQKS